MKVPDFTGAACAEIGVDLFFPDGRGEQEERAKQAVIKICATCPIYNTCLNYALNVKVDGLWAGTTFHERRLMRRRMGIEGINLTSQYISDALLSTNAKAKRKERLIRKQSKAQANV